VNLAAAHRHGIDGPEQFIRRNCGGPAQFYTAIFANQKNDPIVPRDIETPAYPVGSHSGPGFEINGDILTEHFDPDHVSRREFVSQPLEGGALIMDQLHIRSGRHDNQWPLFPAAGVEKT